MNDKIKVLLVDDDESIRYLVKTCLGDGFDIECCDTLSKGTQIVSGTKFDAILLDLGLHDSDGLDTFNRMKEAVIETPIIVLTAREDDDLSNKAIQAGAQDYIYKSDMAILNIRRSVTNAIERQKFLIRAKNAARTVSRCLDRVTELIGEHRG